MAIRKAGPTRDQRAAIVQRYLKPAQNVNWPREMATLSRLWTAYPSLPFWLNYELPFGNGSLNMMTWFESIEGKEELTRAWLLFNYVPVEPAPVVLETALGASSEARLDTAPQSSYTPPISRPMTVAEFLRS